MIVILCHLTDNPAQVSGIIVLNVSGSLNVLRLTGSRNKPKSEEPEPDIEA